MSDRVWRGMAITLAYEFSRDIYPCWMVGGEIVCLPAADYDTLTQALAEARAETDRLNKNLKASIEMLHPSVREGCHLHNELDVSVVVMRLGSMLHSFDEENYTLRTEVETLRAELAKAKADLEKLFKYDGTYCAAVLSGEVGDDD